MKKTTFLLILLLQSFAALPQIAFQKVIGNAHSSYPRDIIQLADTNYLIAGSSSGYGDYTANAFLMKIDQYGDHLWTRDYGGAGSDWAFQLLEESDGSIVFAGYTNSSGNGGYDIWVVKTNANGDVTWSETYGGNDWDFGYSIIKTSDGNYVIAGETYSYGNGNNDAFLLKINPNGDSLWMQYYGGSENEVAKEVIEMSDGKFVFIGSTNTPPVSVNDIWMVKTDSAGTVLWEKKFGTTKADEGHSLVRSRFNDEIVVGGTIDTLGNGKLDQYYFRTDSAGNLLCDFAYGGSENETTHDVCEKWNGFGYIAGQTLSYGYGFGDMIIYYPDNNCSWSGGPSLGTYDRDEAWSVKETLDSGYILLGETEYGPGYTNIYVIKAGSDHFVDPTLISYFDISAVNSSLSEAENFRFFPNPAETSIQIDWGNLEGEIQINWYDLSGRFAGSLTTHSNVTTLNLPRLENGWYLMEIIEWSSQKRISEKILIRNER